MINLMASLTIVLSCGVVGVAIIRRPEFITVRRPLFSSTVVRFFGALLLLVALLGGLSLIVAHL